MKSLYGTIVNHSPRSIFDIVKIYPNVVSMQADKHNEEIPVNAYVLIDYVQSNNPEDYTQNNGLNNAGLYNTNFNIDNQDKPEDLIVDYNQTVWQKRYSDSSKKDFEYFALARLHSILPYIKSTELKGYDNQVIFQRLNAFPLQGELAELNYKDFGVRKDLGRADESGHISYPTFTTAINFDKEAMDTFNKAYPSVDFSKAGNPFIFNQNTTAKEMHDKLINYSFDFPEGRVFSSLYEAYQHINDSNIVNNSYILVDYTLKTDEDYSREDQMDKYTAAYEDLILNENSSAAIIEKVGRYNRSQELDMFYFGIADSSNYFANKQIVIDCFKKYSHEAIFELNGTVKDFNNLKIKIAVQIEQLNNKENLTEEEQALKQNLINKLDEMTLVVDNYETSLEDLRNNQDNKKLLINYHGTIFQKQSNTFVPIDTNRLQLNFVEIDGTGYQDVTQDIPPEEVETPARKVIYALSNANSEDFQGDIENEIVRAECITFIASHNLEPIQDIVREKTNNIMTNITAIESELGNIQNRIDNISDCETEIENMTNSISGSTEKINENSNSIEFLIKGNDGIANKEYENLVNIISTIEDQKNKINTEITAIETKIDSISTALGKIDTSLDSSLEPLINEINNKLAQYKEALTLANKNLTASKEEVASTSTYIITLSEIFGNVDDLISNINANITNLNSITDVNNIKTYTTVIAADVTSISTQLSDFSNTLQSTINETSETIKSLSTATDPGYQNYEVPSGLLDVIKSEINGYITSIRASLNTINQTYCATITNNIMSARTNLQTLNSKLNNIKNLKDQIVTENDNIGTQVRNIKATLAEIKNYRKSIQTSKNNIVILESDNKKLSNEIKNSMDIADDQLNLFNVVNSEYTLYFGMWQWYKYTFLPSIKTIGVEDKALPETCGHYNTYTIEYPTK